VESPTSSDEKNVGFNGSESAVYMTPEEAELARLGYKQEFKREFSWISTFSFAFSISGLLATVPPFMADLIERLPPLGAFHWQLVDHRPRYGVGMVRRGCR
jgi:hypothetical protein